MKNKFQQALEDDDPVAFFSGEGKYFSPDPDWGDHLFVNNWQGACAYIKEKNLPVSVLGDFFFRYLGGVSISYEGAEGLLMNLSAYYGIRRDNGMLQRTDFLDEIGVDGRKKVGQMFRILNKEYDYRNSGGQVRLLGSWLEKIRGDGCKYRLEEL